MPLKALIFDVDGTLADTEQYGHLAACNQAFAELGFPIEWSWTEFMGMLHIPGNATRMRQALKKLDPSLPEAELDLVIAELTRLKERFYIEKCLPNVALRPGVRPLIEAAVKRNLRLAIVSVSNEPQIEALLHHRLAEFVGCFNPILGKYAGPKTAPDSPLYRRCLAELGTAAAETLVIEDSESGFQAAHRAGLPCAVIYNHYTFGQNFTGAALVANSLETFDLDQLAALCLPPSDS